MGGETRQSLRQGLCALGWEEERNWGVGARRAYGWFSSRKRQDTCVGEDLQMTYDGLGDTKEDGEGIFSTRRRD